MWICAIVLLADLRHVCREPRCDSTIISEPYLCTLPCVQVSCCASNIRYVTPAVALTQDLACAINSHRAHFLKPLTSAQQERNFTALLQIRATEDLPDSQRKIVRPVYSQTVTSYSM